MAILTALNALMVRKVLLDGTRISLTFEGMNALQHAIGQIFTINTADLLKYLTMEHQTSMKGERIKQDAVLLY
ncbi:MULTISPECIES: hypothetical protein [unclassified Endozoicomonas]|uniref:hypothetical protein n=1 Tax=unclassified Endozoicomonas TaxID=2644528 RepID=UPI003BB59B2A